jgi:hypothetical protein
MMKTAPMSLWVLAVAMTACSSNASYAVSPAPAAATQAAHRKAQACHKSVVYVSSAQKGTVEIFDRDNLKKGPCGEITGLQAPQGLFVDSKSDLWVADSATQRVYVFAPGDAGAIKTLIDPDGQPGAVAVDENSGTVYVTEIKNEFDATNLVQVYRHGSTMPTTALGDPTARNGGYAAVDTSGNLYVTFMAQDNTAQVDEWLAGSGAPKKLGLKLVSAGAIVTTKGGALAVCDPFGYRCGEFSPGSRAMTHVFGHLGRGVPPGIANKRDDFLMPQALAIDGAENRAYVIAETLSGWRYPAPPHAPNRKPFVEVQVPGLAGNGIAVDPPSPPGKPYELKT